jgi:hypothetical protein
MLSVAKMMISIAKMMILVAPTVLCARQSVQPTPKSPVLFGG